MHPYTNRLIQESSPYLLQHAHNPVDWYPWSEEAFEKAREADKPVLVSIGYAACHWCHVMERESFEDPEVADFMNTHFINIKVDREERPDVDHIYMDAVQAISGGGGWPLNVFLTPEREPFYGGTYFPPQRAFNRASWKEVLISISQAYKEKKEEIGLQARNLTEHLRAANAFAEPKAGRELFEEKTIQEAYHNIMRSADEEWGGFGRAPKFPQTFTINFLLCFHHFYQDQRALDQAVLSIEKMARGGLYDQVGGGFARYATDTEWLVPHFEKMLYDNALLVITLADAYQLTGNEFYRKRMEETLVFVQRELMDTEGGFYSALDADSEGEEGKYYVWEEAAVKEILGADATVFCQYFDITPEGNWEERNILRVLTPPEVFARQQQMEVAELEAVIERGKTKLLRERQKRVAPLLDDKVLLGWNALMNLACTRAYGATGDRRYRTLAEKNMGFILRSFTEGAGRPFYHSWKAGKAKYPAFLDDYAQLIAALLELGQASSDFSLLDRARDLADWVITHFGDPGGSPLFYYTAGEQKDVLLRKKEIYDGAIPSGNAVMAQNLYRLSLIFDRPLWKTRAEDMVRSLGDMIAKYPTSFGVWLSLLTEMIKGTREIAIVGENRESLLVQTLGLYLPHKIIMAAAGPLPQYPLLANKGENKKTLIYLCRNYACLPPVTTVGELGVLL
ncbi:MAG: thioredoxin domain-containing protein [Flavisolibacter sp.]